jgi:hypothetical protein
MVIDRLGQEVNIDDYIVYGRNRGEIGIAKVVAFVEKEATYHFHDTYLGIKLMWDDGTKVTIDSRPKHYVRIVR